MTRVRVLLEAIRLLENGFLPYPGPRARAATGTVVSNLHPDATQFTVAAAIDRAIYNLCNETQEKRSQLSYAVWSALEAYHGGIGSLFRTFGRSDKATSIKLLKDQLNRWEPK